MMANSLSKPKFQDWALLLGSSGTEYTTFLFMLIVLSMRSAPPHGHRVEQQKLGKITKRFCTTFSFWYSKTLGLIWQQESMTALAIWDNYANMHCFWWESGVKGAILQSKVTKKKTSYVAKDANGHSIRLVMHMICSSVIVSASS